MPPTGGSFPCCSCDSKDTSGGKAGTSQRGSLAELAPLAQEQDPWNRLHATPTLSSVRREVWYLEPGVPQDSLDFNLSSLYDHHKELLRNKNQVVIHKETLFDDHGVLKGLDSVQEPKPLPAESRTSQGLPMRCWVSPTKESVHSIKGTIECPHNASTNSGYSRKDNGGFFSQ
ncbi:PREDICTED: uncharacterized protein C1orf194 homolog [Crocodylus porosus]|uniref:uncharacterized protein C1orf194 homolog n=1 Tax=Crocodylus porosus TaxID=8502 RepID=UPI00093B539B|nr:PREDICTED: uncharacterized protein C1orf194 homolog [Crocodylus porosus]